MRGRAERERGRERAALRGREERERASERAVDVRSIFYRGLRRRTEPTPHLFAVTGASSPPSLPSGVVVVVVDDKSSDLDDSDDDDATNLPLTRVAGRGSATQLRMERA